MDASAIHSISSLLSPGAQIGAAEQQRRDVVDAADMLARFAVAELDGGGERLDHAEVELQDLLRAAQQFVLLALHGAAQAFTRVEQFHDRLHPPPHDVRHDRLADDVHNAEVVPFAHDGVAGFGRDEKDRQALRHAPRLQAAQQLDAVDIGHHHIEQHGAQRPFGRFDDLQRFGAAGGFADRVQIGKDGRQQAAVDLVVVHDQQRARDRVQIRQLHKSSLPGAAQRLFSCGSRPVR